MRREEAGTPQLPPPQVEFTEGAVSSAAAVTAARLPGPEGAGVRHPGPAVAGCAAAPRPWLRAGGGRTTRRSCASAASLGARAAPGAVRSPATRPQIATNEINQSIVPQAKDPYHLLER